MFVVVFRLHNCIELYLARAGYLNPPKKLCWGFVLWHAADKYTTSRCNNTWPCSGIRWTELDGGLSDFVCKCAESLWQNLFFNKKLNNLDSACAHNSYRLFHDGHMTKTFKTMKAAVLQLSSWTTAFDFHASLFISICVATCNPLGFTPRPPWHPGAGPLWSYYTEQVAEQHQEHNLTAECVIPRLLSVSVFSLLAVDCKKNDPP